ncbi:G-protein coupled receptor moody isoform X1 [Lutzomyia longipalpis]|nr:G-protein coupled receptor moody isoform X1 [Lutzomyia longipalpis]XP_055693282.1 G-protein coupled receptor moody isoform X1 [Lutzomyia longipalpis]XP_055693283.1 G-protein coupled receptor moody isoform X1 [Lutzomyia longipalpis]
MNENSTIWEAENSPEGEFTRFSRTLLTLGAVFTIIILVVGVFGNLLTIISLIRCPKVRNIAASFIISLCLADFIFCIFVLPFNAIRFIHGSWRLGELLCKLVPFVQYGSIGVSLLCIAMITVNRYVMIVHHSAYARVYQRHWIVAMILFCWIFSYGMQVPTLLGVWGAFGYDSNLGTCSILKDQYGRSSKTPLFVIAFVIPCLLIVLCYTRIFWVVHQSEMRMKQHASVANAVQNNLRPTTGGRLSVDGNASGQVSDSGTPQQRVIPSTAPQPVRIKNQRDIKARRNEWKITKMVLAIFISFIACYLPITVIKIADKDAAHPEAHVFGYVMLYLSACINPIIYVIMNKQYRQAYKTVLLCRSTAMLTPKTPRTSGGNSEKWKDAAFSYNLNRTQVLEVSMGE